MNIDEARDILLKAAEDVQSGMWCKGEWFDGVETAIPTRVDLDQALASRRCAEGSLAVATMQLVSTDRLGKLDEVSHMVGLRVPNCECSTPGMNRLVHFNDEHLPDDPFTAGQQLAELFRETADAL